jgi:homoserine dehydrogenase
VVTEGITGLDVEPGRAIRLVAEATPEARTVKPIELAADDPLAGASGVDNVLEITTADASFSVAGPGAGGPVTAGAVYADVARLVNGERPILFSRG